jgi:hypothetical protein
MISLASLSLLLALSSTAHAEFLSFEEKEPDTILDSTAGALDYAPKSQAAWGKGLKKVGPRCVKGWDTFVTKYDPLEMRFTQFTKSASADVKQIRRDLQGINYSGEDAPAATEVNKVNACNSKASIVDKHMTATKLKVVAAIVKLDSLQDDLGKLSKEGMDIFRDQAGDKYSRRPFCLFKHYYTDVAEIAFGKSPLEHNSDDDSGFAIAQWRLNRASERLSIEQTQIEHLQLKFKVMQGNCNKVPGDKGYNEVPEEDSEGGTSSAQ